MMTCTLLHLVNLLVFPFLLLSLHFLAGDLIIQDYERARMRMRRNGHDRVPPITCAAVCAVCHTGLVTLASLRFYSLAAIFVIPAEVYPLELLHFDSTLNSDLPHEDFPGTVNLRQLGHQAARFVFSLLLQTQNALGYFSVELLQVLSYRATRLVLHRRLRLQAHRF